MFCCGVGRLLPGVSLGLGGQAELAARVRWCGRLRAVGLEYLGLELTAAHGPDLGVLVGDLQSAEGVLAQGFELGFRGAGRS